MAKKKVEKIVEPEITFEDIVAAGPDGIYVFPEVFGPLVEAGLVEVNDQFTEGDAVLCRATEFGLESFYSQAAPVIPQGETKMSKFKIEDGVPVPEVKSVREKIYPFDTMNVGQSFFVPDVTPKSLGSSVAAANARYAVADGTGKTRLVKRGNNIGAVVPVMVKTREFKVYADTKDDIDGVRVFRIA